MRCHLKETQELTPKQIVEALDKYIVGQEKAKKAVAVALRNRYRRRMLSDDLRDEVIPKNILMIGPTGVGKTEIARRLANLANAPFTKVEATKFTEVGYVGRDVDSMVRDLVQRAVAMVETEMIEEVRPIAEQRALERVLDILEPPARRAAGQAAVPKQWMDSLQSAMGHIFPGTGNPPPPMEPEEAEEEQAPTDEYSRDQVERKERIRERLRSQLLAGELDGREIFIEVEDSAMPHFQVFGQQGLEEMGMDMSGMLGNLFPKRQKRKQVTVAEAKSILADQEAHNMIDQDAITREAIERAEQTGIIFVDEMDKIASREGKDGGPQVSREGVQRDILPIIEGSTVTTKFGPVATNHILFIAAGAFHVSKPSDLIPELQGRLPIRVELDSLTEDDFVQILTEPKNALVKQYSALLATEGLEVTFTEDGIREIAKIASEVNTAMENIGARRLHTIMERLLEDVSFAAPDAGQKQITVDAEYVRGRLADIVKDEDLSRYIL